MSGDKVFIDTNIIIYHLNGDKTIESLLQGKDIYISFVSDIEIRSQKTLSGAELKVINQFRSWVQLIHSSNDICDMASTLRRKYNLKVPDAIIASTALCLQLPLISADHRFYSIPDLQTIRYQPR